MGVENQRTVGEPVCPVCSAELSWGNVSFRSTFRCPTCGENLFVPKLYSQRLAWMAVPVAILLAYLVGARGWWWLLVTIILYFPVTVVIASAYRRLIPPHLMSGDQRL